MTQRIWLRLAELLVSAILAIVILSAWQADRRDRAQLATQLAAAQKTIAQASASQRDRDAFLNQTLAQIKSQKQAVVTPAQVLKALPIEIPLPVPITFRPQAKQTTSEANSATHPASGPGQLAAASEVSGQSRDGSSGSPGRALEVPDSPSRKPGQTADALLPAADLKPLYDFALDCKACQAKLAAAQSDLNDEKTKTAALAKQRDAAIRTAKGGSALRRIARAAKWFVMGAAAGAIAAKAAH